MKVIFAVDGTPGADAAVRQAGQLLDPARDAVAFYYALPEVTVRHASSNEAMRTRARQALADAVFESARAGLPPDLAAKAELISDEHVASDGIARAAEAWSADLIVLGARGLEGFERFFLGSVSRSLAQTSKRPVLIVRPNPKHASEHWRVLYAYDGSASSTAALRTAQKLTFPAGSEVTAVTAIESLTVGKIPEWILAKARDADTEAMAAQWEREHEADKRQARDQLGEFMAKQLAPFDKADVVVCEGHAAEQLLRLAEERRIDLIVLGTHGPNLLERLLIGSTSDKVLNHAPCSVLLVRE
jgi:nucleotide-binding universal stress UspA family protein